MGDGPFHYKQAVEASEAINDALEELAQVADDPFRMLVASRQDLFGALLGIGVAGVTGLVHGVLALAAASASNARGGVASSVWLEAFEYTAQADE